MTNKEQFVTMLRSTNRKGMEDCIQTLERLGFFEAPASTKFHLNEAGGLLQHSLNVCRTALKIRTSMIELDASLKYKLPEDSVIIASLLHDTCKADIYRKTITLQKRRFWFPVAVPGYGVDYSKFPLGHGEKSVIVLLRAGLELTDDEIIAIRWHMNAWDLPFQSPEARNNINKAREICPLLTLIQTADGLASSSLERKKRN